MVGKTLGHYEVLEPLGAGGMGEVYRARDTQLDCDVALKLLTESFAADPDRLMRFEREAKTLASLNHPNIAQVYGLERSGPQQAIVMELVPGPTLEEAIRANAGLRGSTSDLLEWALPIARRLADALETAHEAGIIHRDLKPANIKVSDDTVKVLDFGLAKALNPAATSGKPGARANDATSPTMTSPALTAMGVILGTAAYMAPEQARGRSVDRRVDIWAFGCVLYEMLVGTAPFGGETITDVLASVVKESPDWEALPAKLPRSLRRLLERCLEKDPRRRLRDIGDARLELEDLARSPEEAGAEDEARPTAVRGWMVAAALLLAAIAFVAGGGLAPAPDARLLQLDVDFGGNLELQTDIALSRDGERVAFIGRDEEGRNHLFTRRFDDGRAIRLREVGERFGNPVLFVRRPFDRLGRWNPAPAGSGRGRTRHDHHRGRREARWGGRWGADEIFVNMTFTQSTRISVADGTSTVVTQRDDFSFLPDGRSLLFSDGREIGVIAAGEDEPHRAAPFAGSEPRYLPSGHLLFVDDGVLQAVAFDRTSLEAAGAPVALVEDVRWFTASDTGTVIFGHQTGTPEFQVALAWFDEAGNIEVVAEPPQSRGFSQPQLSPDGKQVAFTFTGADPYVAILDLERGTTRRLTPPGLATSHPPRARGPASPCVPPPTPGSDIHLCRGRRRARARPHCRRSGRG